MEFWNITTLSVLSSCYMQLENDYNLYMIRHGQVKLVFVIYCTHILYVQLEEEPCTYLSTSSSSSTEVIHFFIFVGNCVVYSHPQLLHTLSHTIYLLRETVAMSTSGITGPDPPMHFEKSMKRTSFVLLVSFYNFSDHDLLFIHVPLPNLTTFILLCNPFPPGSLAHTSTTSAQQSKSATEEWDLLRL